MKTHSAAQVGQNLAHFLKRAVNGEDIGIVYGDKIVALRPVEVYAEDYALVEYGLTDDQLNRAARKLNRIARKKGKTWDGTLKGLRG